MKGGGAIVQLQLGDGRSGRRSRRSSASAATTGGGRGRGQQGVSRRRREGGQPRQRVRVCATVQALECRVVAGLCQQLQPDAGRPFPLGPEAKLVSSHSFSTDMLSL